MSFNLIFFVTAIHLPSTVLRSFKPRSPGGRPRERASPPVRRGQSPSAAPGWVVSVAKVLIFFGNEVNEQKFIDAHCSFLWNGSNMIPRFLPVPLGSN